MRTPRESVPALAPWRRTAPAGDEPRLSAADHLLRTWPGRLFLASAALKLVVGVLRLLGAFPAVVDALSAVATIGIVVTLGFFVWRLFMLTKSRLLWAVRRKLILSYIFIGVVPSLLIVIFFLLGGMLIFMSVSAYLFKDGYDAALNYVKVTTEGAAGEIARAPESATQSLARTHRNASKLYRTISFAYLPAPGAPRELAERFQAGSWDHLKPPSSVPPWITRDGWNGTITVLAADEPGHVELVNRAVAAVVTDGRLAGYIVGDLAIDDDMVQSLREKTGVRAGTAALIGTPRDGRSTALTTDPNVDKEGGWSTLFRKSVIFLDSVDWATGNAGRVSIALTYRPTDLYRRLSDAQQMLIRGVPLGVVFIIGLLIIAGLFLITLKLRDQCAWQVDQSLGQI